MEGQEKDLGKKGKHQSGRLLQMKNFIYFFKIVFVTFAMHKEANIKDILLFVNDYTKIGVGVASVGAGVLKKEGGWLRGALRGP